MYFKKEKYVVPANKFGKAATLMFSLAIMAILFAPQVKELIYLVFFALFLKIVAFSSYAIHHSKNIEKLKWIGVKREANCWKVGSFFMSLRKLL